MSPNCPVCGAFIAHLRDTHSCPGPSGRVSVVDPRDAQIAALTERLRAVEAERNEAIADARETNDVYDALIRSNREAIEACGLSRVPGKGSLKNDEAVSAPEILTRGFLALRAELERKDAALTKAREDRAEAAERLSKQAARWLDDFIADSELIGAINGELDAALENLRSDNDGK